MKGPGSEAENRPPVISTIPEKCRRCYTCVRECPAKAIKVEEGQAVVIENRCIACGNCVKVCAQKAKHIQDSTVEVRQLLAGDKPVFACLAPSFPAAFSDLSPGQVVAAVRALGFHAVWEVAFGAELVSREYTRLFHESERTGAKVVATACPAIVAYVEKYMPELLDVLAPVVSPMVATARAVRKRCPDAAVVFIGPCIAKKNEMRKPAVAGCVDAVLTFPELGRMLEADGLDATEMTESGFDSPRCYFGRTFPITGGLLKTAGLGADILESEIVMTDGKDRALAVLKELVTGRSKARCFDILFCEGCISGPKMANDLSMLVRKERVVDFVNVQGRYTAQRDLVEGMAEFADLDMGRYFTAQNIELTEPSEEEIEQTLASMRKLRPEDQLNCGACGYPTCREKAIAVWQGLAEPQMCLPYLIEELQQTCESLQNSHVKLASAQQRLVQTERLASMGQLSAGVAHEINNPLGTVLIYSHMLLKQLQEDDPKRTDLLMVVKEADRCKKIVRGLLDFARQSRISKAATDLTRVLEEVRVVMAPKAKQHEVVLDFSVKNDLPVMMIDGDQVKQMLINLVGNGLDAIDGAGGVVQVRAWPESERCVALEVSDNGVGIPEEHIAKLFTPFFTTKEIGQGTGLGLAIAYGIVKMHSGDIKARSEVGKGTTFTITLPVSDNGAPGHSEV